ncbi:MAG: acetyl-CoA carboxylase biotin carboxyl carrier protein subunit [Chloroflexi bacterium]|nr:acetyl-CoA carboxylase biotin carboxyl carrier protein subunit [Chloroflexota bacterium]
MKSFKLTVRGQTYRIEIPDLTQRPLTVWVDGEAFVVEVEEGAAGTATPAAPRPAAISPPPPPAAVPAPPPVAAPPAAGQVRAPMPGKVLRVTAEVGQRVERGQELVVLEAMKMEQSLKAPATGVVKAVLVAPGQNVAVGAVLVELG